MDFTLALILTMAISAFWFFIGFIAGESKKVRDLRLLITDFYKDLADIDTQINYSQHFSQKVEGRVHNLLAKIEVEKLF